MARRKKGNVEERMRRKMEEAKVSEHSGGGSTPSRGKRGGCRVGYGRKRAGLGLRIYRPEPLAWYILCYRSAWYNFSLAIFMQREELRRGPKLRQ